MKCDTLETRTLWNTLASVNHNELIEKPSKVEKAEKVTPPPFYKVIMLNDDFTPMEFVVLLLQTFFGMEYERAQRVMLQIHQQGRGVCGHYPREIAESKCHQVIRAARESSYPLQCVIEKG
ncbi:MAG: ATP-dependent Clp protease adapter ClpS [Gammaproteobacteria bacterium]|nr:MAG: ATP-dependent Clp protease adapter ClpS [Gammaproteobacteria bacterium]